MDERSIRIAHEMTTMVTRQTGLTYDEAKDQLKLHSGDYMKVIREAHGITDKVSDKVASKSQERYRQIRSCMDSAALSYQANKERQEAIAALHAKKD